MPHVVRIAVYILLRPPVNRHTCPLTCSCFISAEFLHAEGLTEAELRDACEKEMQAEDPGGHSFMHTLISSWEFSRQARVCPHIAFS